VEFQPWFKVFADLPERKAHYNDGQFRAFVELLCASAASRTPGEFPSMAAVRRIVGDVAHFLTEQGDLDVNKAGVVRIHGWDKYQRPIDRTNAARQARHREKVREHGVSNGVDNALSTRYSPSSISTTTSTPTPTPEGDGLGAREEEFDSRDVYYELTGFRPWGLWSGDALEGAMKEYGDAAVTACLREVHAKKPGRKDLLPDTLALLAKRAEQARRKKVPAPRKTAAIDRERYEAIRAEIANGGGVE
jgi:hypothetical protein